MANISLELEHTTFTAGSPVCGVVTFRTGKVTPVRGLGVRLHGVEGVKQSAARQANVSAASRRFLRQDFVLAGRAGLESAASWISDTWNTLMGRISHTRLQPGVSRHPFCLFVPPTAVPTYDGEGIYTSYAVTAYADRPFRKEINTTIEVLITAAPKSEPPHPFATTNNGLEVELDSNKLPAGGTVTGKFRLQLPQGSKAEGLRITLVRREVASYRARMKEVSKAEIAVAELEFDDQKSPLQEGTLSLQIPPGAHPSFEGHLIALRWTLRIETQPIGLAAVEAPLTVVG
ncbi:MAG: hypothetical protein Q7N50_07115 [Armatimonadota bacterium]|nr:hypothetical protein [Armatimonadota bacterium]